MASESRRSLLYLPILAIRHLPVHSVDYVRELELLLSRLTRYSYNQLTDKSSIQPVIPAAESQLPEREMVDFYILHLHGDHSGRDLATSGSRAEKEAKTPGLGQFVAFLSRHGITPV